MTHDEELIELRRIGDRMQSSLSRILQACEDHGVEFGYEAEAARREGARAIREWTNVRRKSLRMFYSNRESV